jgi:hypothetical protein
VDKNRNLQNGIGIQMRQIQAIEIKEWKEEEEIKQQAAARNVKMSEKQEHYL